MVYNAVHYNNFIETSFMGKRFVLFLSFGLVFALGFVIGRSTNCDLRSQSQEGNCDLCSQPSADEDRIAKALEDPDFKRIHDYLNRERPMQLQIPALHEEPPQEKIPMTERPPVKFTLE